MVVPIGVGFDQADQRTRKQAGEPRRPQPPGEEARREGGATPSSPAPARWTRRLVRASVEAVTEDRRSGLWRLWQRCRIRRRPIGAHLYSPDPE